MAYMPIFAARAPTRLAVRQFRPQPLIPRFLTPLPALVRPVNTATYVSGLINGILLRLNESADTSAFNLEPGTGGAATIGLAGAALEYLNEAAADLTRTGGYPIPGTATYTRLPAGTTSVAFSDPHLAMGDTSVPWAAREVSWGGTPLTYCEKSRLDAHKALIPDTPPPLYWYRLGEEGIGIYPTPTTAADLVVRGLVIPPLLAYTSERPSWLMDDLAKLLVWYDCAQIAKKNADDPSLAARYSEWGAAYQHGKQAVLTRLWVSDPGLARAHYPMPMGEK
jgi:hypothetical protein